MRVVDAILMTAAGIAAIVFAANEGNPVGVLFGVALLGYAAYIGLGSGGYAMPLILYVLAIAVIAVGVQAVAGG